MWTVTLSPGFISRVCELGVNVARLRLLRARRPGGHAVGLDEGEVDRLGAVVVAGAAAVARCTPGCRCSAPSTSACRHSWSRPRTARSRAGRTAAPRTPGRHPGTCRAARWRRTRRARQRAAPSCGSQTVVEIHGATDSSNQCVTSWPGRLDRRHGRRVAGRVSFMLKLLPEPGRVETEPHGRLVVPDVVPVLEEPAAPDARALGVRAGQVELDGVLDGAKPVAVKLADLVGRDHDGRVPRGWARLPPRGSGSGRRATARRRRPGPTGLAGVGL